jgi:hypothetical protein
MTSETYAYELFPFENHCRATKVGTLRQFSSINNVEVGQGDQIGRILAQCPCFGSFMTITVIGHILGYFLPRLRLIINF